MSELIGKPAELSFTLTITRAATGEVITVPMVGHVVRDEEETEPESLTEDPEKE